MNAKVLIAAVLSLAGLASSADVLYWQVNNTAADANSAASSRNNYSYAYLRASDDAGQYYVSQNIDAAGENAGAAISRDYFASGNYVGGVLDLANILSTSGGDGPSSITDLSFFIELYDSTGNWVGETSAKTYDQLVTSGAISSGFNANFQGVNAAMGSAGSNAAYQIPEPTSGLLMLVGLGALALRRRKVA